MLINGFYVGRTSAYCWKCAASPAGLDFGIPSLHGMEVTARCHGETEQRTLSSSALMLAQQDDLFKMLVFFKPVVFEHAKRDPVVVKMRQLLRKQRRG